MISFELDKIRLMASSQSYFELTRYESFLPPHQFNVNKCTTDCNNNIFPLSFLIDDQCD